MDYQQIINSCINVIEENLLFAPKTAIFMQLKYANRMKSMELINLYCKDYNNTKKTSEYTFFTD